MGIFSSQKQILSFYLFLYLQGNDGSLYRIEVAQSHTRVQLNNSTNEYSAVDALGEEVWSFGSLIGYKRDLLSDTGRLRHAFFCAKCRLVSTTKYSLIRHQRGNHGLPGGLSCPQCGKVAGDKFNLDAHMTIHNMNYI